MSLLAILSAQVLLILLKLENLIFLTYQVRDLISTIILKIVFCGNLTHNGLDSQLRITFTMILDKFIQVAVLIVS